jgi:phosphorylcholine metabolism protein LicD
MIKNDETIARKIWDIELSILNEFDSFCAQNDIRYFVDYGTLLEQSATKDSFSGMTT